MPLYAPSLIYAALPDARGRTAQEAAMAISELYVVRHLLQETLDVRQDMIWKETKSEGYSVSANGVLVELFPVDSSTGSRLFLTLSQGDEKVQIAEPVRSGFVRPRYPTEDQRQLAFGIRELAAAVRRQCENRKLAALRSEAAIRDAIFRRLLFGGTDTAPSETGAAGAK